MGTMKKVTEDIEAMSFNTAISAMMVSPFAPHLGEECWNILGNDDSLAYAPWVEYDEALCVDDEITIGVQINGKSRGQITIPADADEDTAMAAARDVEKLKSQLDGKEIRKIIFV